jgi:hypothetical protein
MHFRIFQSILSLASPVFTDMFIMPSPSSQNPDEIQVVRLSEHSTALDVALRHIYPVRPPEVADTILWGSILAEFARKYQVETLDNFIIGYLTDSIENDPVGVYAIAVTHEYNGIAANAVRSCLNLPFSGLESPYLRCTTMERILELLKYHVACGEAASAVASSNLEWLSSLDKDGTFASQLRNSSQGCQSCSTRELIAQSERTRRSGPQFLWDYLYRSALVLAHHPIAEQITSEDFVLKTNKCYSCASSIRYGMLEVSVVLEGEIENAVKRVSLCLRCSGMSALRTHIWQVPLPKAVSMEPSTGSNAATN